MQRTNLRTTSSPTSLLRRGASWSAGALALFAFATSAHAGVGAHSYDIDFGSGPAPSNGYAGAGAVGGVWNAIPTAYVSSLLVDTSGTWTGASITLSNALVAGGSAATTYGPDDDALLSDFEVVTLPNTWTLYLEPGEYDVIVHAFDPSDSSALTDVTIVDASGVRFSGTCGGSSGPDAEPFVPGTTHVAARVDVASAGPFANRFDVAVQGAGGPGRLNGIQIRPRPKAYFIDIGTNPASTPYLGYAAAAPYPGHWQTVAPTPLCFDMDDIHGVRDAAVCPAGPTYFTGLGGSLTGNDGKLMRDFQDVGTAGNSVRWDFLVDAGSYTVLVYSWSPDAPLSTTIVDVSGSAGSQACGGADWPGAHQLGITYVEFQTTTLDGWIHVDVQTQSGLGAVNGIQILPRTSSFFTPFCFGDGTGTACPCGNVGAPGNGCGSSLFFQGANLSASGVPSLSADTFVLQGTNMPNSSALYFQGTSQVSAGMGVLFGDGLRCAGGSILRLGAKSNSAGSSQYPIGGDLSISVRGLNSPGDVRTYQCWYRNASAFCTPSTFNLTNGIETTWIP